MTPPVRGRKGRAGARAPRERGQAGRPDLVLSIPSQTSFLALVQDLTRRLAEAAGFSAATSDQVALAVDEAATNVIEHAYRGDPGQRLELRFQDLGDDFQVELLDTGATVDPEAIPPVDLERMVSERRKGGLGVYLMEKIMDSVTFQRSARRNVCRLVKHKQERAVSRPE